MTSLKRKRHSRQDALAGLEKRAHMDEAQTIAAAAAELDAACAEAKNADIKQKRGYNKQDNRRD